MDQEEKERLTVNWWSPESDIIPEDHVKILERYAIDIGFGLYHKGHKSGDLQKTIGDTMYQGHWRIVNRKN